MKTAIKYFYTYPLHNYHRVWKSYRRKTNEQQKIAKFLCEIWQNSCPKSILDIGCGDGRLLTLAIENSNNTYEKIGLVDPDESILKDALSITKKLNSLCSQVESFCYGLQEVGIDTFRQYEFILLSHVIYHLSKQDLERMFDLLPKGVHCCIITNNHNSLFTKILRHTSKNYSRKLHENIQTIQKLNQTKYRVQEFDIFFEISNPLFVRDIKLRNDLLSFMCYHDFQLLSPGIQSKVVLEINKKLKDRVLKNSISCFLVYKI